MTARQTDKILLKLFTEKKIATMDEMKVVLGTRVDMTVYRALKRLSYHTSYSHGGQYYALVRLIQFDDLGLWAIGDVRFSKSGTLADTLEHFINTSRAGCFAHELETALQVSVRETLLRLINKNRITRQRVTHCYLYTAKNAALRRRQNAAREAELGEPITGALSQQHLSDDVQAAIILFTALLDERQIRLFAGVEALQFGPGSERWLAELLGIHQQTVAKGRRELLDGDVDFERVRKKGAGRPPVEKKAQKSSKKSKS
jgi:hypothetical protein